MRADDFTAALGNSFDLYASRSYHIKLFCSVKWDILLASGIAFHMVAHNNITCQLL